jgi:hypothetical protein
MYNNKKERLYINDILPDPAITQPAYYILSLALIKNEMLQQSLIDIHSYNFNNYTTPKSYDSIFNSFNMGLFPIYKEKYAIGYFGSKMMYLDSYGWKAMPCNKDVFNLENWLVS